MSLFTGGNGCHWPERGLCLWASSLALAFRFWLLQGLAVGLGQVAQPLCAHPETLQEFGETHIEAHPLGSRAGRSFH